MGKSFTLSSVKSQMQSFCASNFASGTPCVVGFKSNVPNSVFDSTDRAMVIVTRHTCICNPGFEVLPTEQGTCKPCPAGTQRSESQQEVGDFFFYKKLQRSMACNPCNPCLLCFSFSCSS